MHNSFSFLFLYCQSITFYLGLLVWHSIHFYLIISKFKTVERIWPVQNVFLFFFLSQINCVCLTSSLVSVMTGREGGGREKRGRRKREKKKRKKEREKGKKGKTKNSWNIISSWSFSWSCFQLNIFRIRKYMLKVLYSKKKKSLPTFISFLYDFVTHCRYSIR